MTDHSDKMCDACPFHGTQDYRLGELERENQSLKECVSEIKVKLNTIATGQAVMQQKFDNIRVPIWIIFGAFLLQIAKWLTSFTPVAASVAEKVM